MVRKKNQSGQIALIALLVLTVATTVGLSLIGRSTTDVSVTRNIEESNRAFSAAEAGIEEGLAPGFSGPTGVVIDPALGVKYSIAVTPVGGSDRTFIFPQPTSREDTETVWLVGHKSDGTIDDTVKYTGSLIDACWSSGPPIPGVVVSVLYKTGAGVYRVAKATYDDSAAGRADNFSEPTAKSGGCGAGTNTTYRSRITFSDYGILGSDTPISLRIRPVYSGAQIAVAPESGHPLPSQGSTVESTGTSGSDVNRKIIAFKQYRAPAPIFDYAVYSETGSFSQ
jgi:hypothetical protein